MTKLRNSGLMLDGMRSGSVLDSITTDSGTGITYDDIHYLEQIFYKFGMSNADAIDLSDTQAKVSIIVRNEQNRKASAMKVTLLKKSNNSNLGWLNVQGNPISFLTGKNYIGGLDIGNQVSEVYATIFKIIRSKVPEFEIPESVQFHLNEQAINIHSLAFACYSDTLQFKDWANIKYLLQAIHLVFNHGLKKDALNYLTLSDILNVRVIKEGDTSLRFERFQQRNRYQSLTMYNKYVEMKENGIRKPPEELKDVLRYDLLLFNKWFSSNDIKTFSDFSAKSKGDMDTFVRSLFTKFLSDIGFVYALNCPNPPHQRDVPFPYVKDYSKWMSHEMSLNTSTKKTKNLEITPATKAWFLKEYHLDLNFSYSFHVLALSARMFQNTSIEEMADALYYRDIGRLTKTFEANLDNRTNLNLLKAIPRMAPNFNFLLDN